MFRKRHPPPGARPGTLMIDGAAPPVIRIMKYTPGELVEHEGVTVADATALLDDDSVSWIDVQGLGDEATLRALAQHFDIHLLALEDVVNTPQRPKIERFEQHTLCIMRMLRLVDGAVAAEQVSVFLGPNYVLTFRERAGDAFDAVRARIRQGGPIFRSSGPSYLAYALLDAVIDAYYPVMERVSERIDELDDAVIENPSPSLLHEVHETKRTLLRLRRAVWPQREAITAMLRDEDPLITDAVRVYLRDCYDHCVQLMDVIDAHRELAASLMDVYLSSVGNRQNEVMKTLTIMASIFIPLTFLAGIYGMNFEHMPELHARWGYPVLLIVMAGVTAALLWYFRRQGWLGGPRSR